MQMDVIKRFILILSNSKLYLISSVLPESVRWLLSKNKEDEAKEIMKKVAKTNKVVLSDSMLDNLTHTKDQLEVPDDRKYTFVDLLRPLSMFSMSINVWFNW